VTVAVKPPWPLVVTVTGVPPAFTVTVALAGKLLPVTVIVPPGRTVTGEIEIWGVPTVIVVVADRPVFWSVAVTVVDPGVVGAVIVAVNVPLLSAVAVTVVLPMLTFTCAPAAKPLPETVIVPPGLTVVGLTEIWGPITLYLAVADRAAFISLAVTVYDPGRRGTVIDPEKAPVLSAVTVADV
jgi:hypothetical protein